MHTKQDITDLSDSDVSRIVHALFIRLVQVLEELRSPVEAARSRPRISLTTREYQVVRCLLAGATCKQAGKILGISPRTVEAHKSRAMEKLWVVTQAHFIRRLIELGVTPDPRVAALSAEGEMSLSEFLSIIEGHGNEDR